MSTTTSPPRDFISKSRVKTRRVVKALESLLGIPVQAERLPSPLEMLIATILSQNTNDKNSHRAYTALRKRFRSFREMAEAPVSAIRSAIRVGGMANQKSARIKHTLKAVKQQYGTYSLASLEKKSNDEVIDELTALDGVGFKTASCVLLFSMRRDVFPVDTHVHRICNRLGLVRNCPTPEKTFEQMKRLVPEGKGYSFHTNLIRFGRKICRSSSPACDICPLYALCEYNDKSSMKPRKKMPSAAAHDFMLLDNV